MPVVGMAEYACAPDTGVAVMEDERLELVGTTPQGFRTPTAGFWVILDKLVSY